MTQKFQAASSEEEEDGVLEVRDSPEEMYEEKRGKIV